MFPEFSSFGSHLAGSPSWSKSPSSNWYHAVNVAMTGDTAQSRKEGRIPWPSFFPLASLLLMPPIVSLERSLENADCGGWA
jgi:hypothetical protein